MKNNRVAKIFLRSFAGILSFLCCFGAFSSVFRAESVTEKQAGAFVSFGMYPQSEVKDSALIKKLNAIKADWCSFNYYSGTDILYDGNMSPSDYMVYKDVQLDGVKYRAVYFTKYRPILTSYKLSENPDPVSNWPTQYSVNTVYWFQYEPIKWRVLDPQSGLLISEYLLDSQPFNNTVFLNGGKYYKDKTRTVAANEYQSSDLRAWLNKDFYELAFTSYQKNVINTTRIDSSEVTGLDGGRGIISVDPTKTHQDKVFILSWKEVENPKYGLVDYSARDNDDLARLTDYATCLTPNSSQSPTNRFFWLRTKSWRGFSATSCGTLPEYSWVVDAVSGVRPAITVDPKKDLAPPRSIATMYGDVDLDGKVTAKDARLALRYSARLETLSAIQIANAAVINQDNTTVTAADARKILRYSAKLEPSFPKVVKPTAFRSPDGVFEKKDANIDLNGVIAAVGMKWSELSGLGNPSGRTEVPALYGSNVDIIYSFSGFEVYTTMIDGVETVYEIDLNSPKYATPKGIRVGSTAVDVLDRYGEYPETMTDECFSYFSECNGIDFQIHAGVVIGIQIYTTS